MFKLSSDNYRKVIPFIQSQNELSVNSVLNDIMPGEVYVNNIDHPTAALIKTSECNLIAGSCDDSDFNSAISTVIDFWDQLTPDSDAWIDIIPAIHKNPFVKKYKRRHYTLTSDQFRECNRPINDDFILEKVDIDFLRHCNYENVENLLGWISNWGEDEVFQKYGVGNYIHNGKTIVSWSFSDCSYGNKIAIGIHTDESFRKNGFGQIVASVTAKACFAKGYETIEWLCVDTNKGSIAIAEKLGFSYSNSYHSFSSYPPIENIGDLSEAEWRDWGTYLENASHTIDTLLWDSLYCYIKANDINKTIGIMTALEQKKTPPDYSRFQSYITDLQSYGYCSNFQSQTWIDFINPMRKETME